MFLFGREMSLAGVHWRELGKWFWFEIARGKWLCVVLAGSFALWSLGRAPPPPQGCAGHGHCGCMPWSWRVKWACWSLLVEVCECLYSNSMCQSSTQHVFILSAILGSMGKHIWWKMFPLALERPAYTWVTCTTEWWRVCALESDCLGPDIICATTNGVTLDKLLNLFWDSVLTLKTRIIVVPI